MDSDEVCSFAKLFNVSSGWILVCIAPERRMSIEVTSYDCSSKYVLCSGKCESLFWWAVDVKKGKLFIAIPDVCFLDVVGLVCIE